MLLPANAVEVVKDGDESFCCTVERDLLECEQPTNLNGLFLAVTNKKPTQASITKVKQFEGSTSFVRRSQWMLEQLRQVNGIDPNRDSAEFDLLFENTFDQWVASTASEKCTFFQILHHTCQRYLTDRKPEFINCQSKIMG
uniref:Syntaxin-binding protein 6 n=1 Tax=Castor canadensis TaxID=51338 RepID=A0A8B7U9Y3_CASCN